MSSLIENILNAFIVSKKRSMRIADLQSKLIETNTPLNLIELNETLQRLKPLFAFTYIGQDLAFRLVIFFFIIKLEHID